MINDGNGRTVQLSRTVPFEPLDKGLCARGHGRKAIRAKVPSVKAKMEKKRLNGLRKAMEPPDSQAMPTHNIAKPAHANPVERRATIWAFSSPATQRR